MMGFPDKAVVKCKEKGSAAVDNAQKTGGALPDISDLQKKMDEQVKQMKDLSKVTMEIVEKVKKLKVADVSHSLDSIDERLDALEKKIELQKREIAHGVTAAEAPLADIGHDAPLNAESHVIESTMDPPLKDTVSQTIEHYEKGKPDNLEPGKGNIFSNIMKKVLPAHKKQEPLPEVMGNNASLDAQENAAPAEVNAPQPVNDVTKAPDIIAACAPEEKTVPNACACNPAIVEEVPPASTIPLNDDANPLNISDNPIPANPAQTQQNPEVDLLAIDKRELKSKMEEMIASASQMAAERKFSEATEVYLKLADAYEKNKDDPAIQALASGIDTLYDKISSNLLNNLMTNDTGKKVSVFEGN